MNTKVLVLGRSGQLASELFERKGADPSFRFLSREEMDVTDPLKLARTIESFRPQHVINCAAYTAVDKAETEVESCFALNRDLVARLAHWTNQFDFNLIHFSTDYVFSGDAKSPYVETDATDPINTYGRSKLEGEERIFEFAKAATILRTSWVYSKYGNNFVKTMLRLANQRSVMKVVGDQFGCPTWAGDLAEVILTSLLKPNAGVDLFHFSGGGQTTWSEFAKEVLRQKKIDHPIESISTAEFPTPAKRPRYSVLSKGKVVSQLGINVPSWQDSLNKCFETWS